MFKAQHGITEVPFIELIYSLFLGICMKAAPGSSIRISRQVFEICVCFSRLNTFSGCSSKSTSLLKWFWLAYSFPSQSPSFFLLPLFALSGMSLITPAKCWWSQVKQLKAVLIMSSDFLQRASEIRTDFVSLDAHVFAYSFSCLSSPLTKETESFWMLGNFSTAFWELTWAQCMFL